MESGFEGAFNNYAASDRDIHGNIITMATNAGDAGFQGIEPMGKATCSSSLERSVGKAVSANIQKGLALATNYCF